MDQSHDLSSLVSRLQQILSSQPLPVPGSTSSSSATVLPKTIAQLPPQAVTLSDSTPSDPLTHLSDLLKTHILPYLNACSLSPNYYGFVTGGATPAALLADWLVGVYDQNVQVHLPAETIATNVEVAALGLLVQLFNLPGEWNVGTTGGGGGTFTTGATASNVLGLALGREWVIAQALRRVNNQTTKSGLDHCEQVTSVGESGLLEACFAAGITNIQILSTMPHSSIAKAASIIGIGRSNVISIANDDTTHDALSIDLAKLEHLTTTMHDQGKAYILAISAGEVNTGRFATNGLETMRRVRQLCDQHGIWIHVDGAFGLFARILANTTTDTNAYDSIVSGVIGLELADSITGDGHKLLNVPYDAGIFLTRHKQLSEAVFQNGNAAYLTSSIRDDNDGGPTIQSPLNIGIENSRRFRALPVWATLAAYGRQGYVEMLERQIGLARRVVRWMWTVPGFEVLPKCTSVEEAVDCTFMVVLFRAKDPEVNAVLVRQINASGRIYVTGTKWEGQPAARIAISNWQVDVERDGALIEEVLSQCLA